MSDNNEEEDTTIYKRRREGKSKSEAKRRGKFNEQLTSLKKLLFADNDDQMQITRDHIMNAAITEITRLRNVVAQFEQRGTPDNRLIPSHTTNVSNTDRITVPQSSPPVEGSRYSFIPGFQVPYFQFAPPHPTIIPQELHTSTILPIEDPITRTTLNQEAEISFRTLFAKQWTTWWRLRSEESRFDALRTLEELSIQSGKPELQLFVCLLEEVYYSSLKNIPQEVIRCIEKTWVLYQQVKKIGDKALIFPGMAHVGLYILYDMSANKLLLGRFKESNQTWKLTKELTRRLSHSVTTGIFFAFLPLMKYLRQDRLAMDQAKRIVEQLQNTHFSVFANLILGQVLIDEGDYDSGYNCIEKATDDLVNGIGPLSDIGYGHILIDACIRCGQVEKGLKYINIMLNKCADYNLEGSLGRSELWRLKGKLLLLKRRRQIVQCAKHFFPTHTNVDLYRELDSDLVERCLAEPLVNTSEVESLFKSAFQDAQSRGLVVIELKCGIELAQLFLETGDTNLKAHGANILRSVCAKFEEPPEFEGVVFPDYATAVHLIQLLSNVEFRPQ